MGRGGWHCSNAPTNSHTQQRTATIARRQHPNQTSLQANVHPLGRFRSFNQIIIVIDRET